MLTLYKKDPSSADICAASLLRGEVIICPTDTVYGLSAIADDPFTQNDSGASSIQKIKGRKEDKPFIILISEPKDIFQYTDDKIPPVILDKWPCALTIVVKARQRRATVAIRCPKDEWLRKVINICKKPIYSTSANISGSPVLHTAKDIKEKFDCSPVSLFVDDGEKNALPSTVISVLEGKTKILRQGSVWITCG